MGRTTIGSAVVGGGAKNYHIRIRMYGIGPQKSAMIIIKLRTNFLKKKDTFGDPTSHSHRLSNACYMLFVLFYIYICKPCYTSEV